MYFNKCLYTIDIIVCNKKKLENEYNMNLNGCRQFDLDVYKNNVI